MKKNEAEGIERDSMAPKEKNSREGARKGEHMEVGRSEEESIEKQRRLKINAYF